MSFMSNIKFKPKLTKSKHKKWVAKKVSDATSEHRPHAQLIFALSSSTNCRVSKNSFYSKTRFISFSSPLRNHFDTYILQCAVLLTLFLLAHKHQKVKKLVFIQLFSFCFIFFNHQIKKEKSTYENW
jgi:hypothetical protein